MNIQQSYENVLDAFRKLMPLDWEAILLNKTTNDVACDWRRIRVCYKNSHIDIHVTKNDFSVDLAYKIINPCKTWFANKDQIKMTREEATYKVQRKSGYEGICARELVDALEALGLLKFEEEKPIVKLCSAHQDGIYNIRVEQWPEGIVVWYNGEIVYRSWKP